VHAEALLRVLKDRRARTSRLLGQFGSLLRLHSPNLVDTHTNLDMVDVSTF
jgi:hypothetical protein